MAGGGLRLEEVRSFARLEEVREAWQALWHRAVAATPFSAPAWLLPWCRHLAPGPPLALLAWRGDALAALAPAFVYGEGGARVLGLLGGGVSDYQDVLAEDAGGAAAALGWMRERGRGFDRCRLEALPADSALLAALSPGERRALAPQEVCPVLALPPHGDWLAGVASSRLLADVRRQRRRLGEAGHFEVAHARGAAALPMVEDLFRLHRARWESRGEPGVLGSRAVRAFHAEAAPGLAAMGLLRVTALRLDDRSFAVLYALAARGRVHAYLQGIDPALARFSPGSVLVAAAIEGAVADGARELDMCRGGEPYKYRWGAVDRPTFRLELPPRPAAPAPSPEAAPPP
jgi:CelD/BcsL family acetyltransferase involved in cellulose biosynthesis